jgi:ClpP class serine protease
LEPLEKGLKELFSFKSNMETEYERCLSSLSLDYQGYLSEMNKFQEQKTHEKKFLFQEIEKLRKLFYDKVEKEIALEDNKNKSIEKISRKEELLRQLESF